MYSATLLSWRETLGLARDPVAIPNRCKYCKGVLNSHNKIGVCGPCRHANDLPGLLNDRGPRFFGATRVLPGLTPEHVLEAVVLVFHVSPATILSAEKEEVNPIRHVLAYLLRSDCGMPVRKASVFFGRSNSTMVTDGSARVARTYETDALLRKKIAAIRSKYPRNVRFLLSKEEGGIAR